MSKKDGQPLVSVVCTNYNKGSWIGDAIESFLRQKTGFSYEIVVIDDKSTDNSPDIIREYGKKYPKLVRTFFNDKNLGITKTWIKVCKEVKGKYIARCDGDDYWIDDNKLQKQVDLLESTKGSRWCSTDYNIITPDGRLVHESAFETGLVDRSKTYAEMVANKGFTMSSTWLVDTELMRKVNDGLDTSAVDDTFNIQLELFNKTKLSYLPEPTVVYRINEGSDSRPVEMDIIRDRHGRLLDTQLEFIEKYKDVDYGDILKILFKRDMEMEMLAVERLKDIYKQRDYIAELEAKVNRLESSMQDITNSKSYRTIVRLVGFVRFALSIPRKIIRRTLWVDGHRRYWRFHKQSQTPESGLRDERERSLDFSYRPLFSIIVPTFDTDHLFFREMVDSVMAQTYDNWELVFIDDASPDSSVRELIKEYAKKDDRIVYRFLKTNHHIAGATNEGIKIAKGEFISLLDHDDVLHPSALYEIAKSLNKDRTLEFIYTDEDKINEKGKHIDPFLKPDWNQELLYSQNYITHFVAIKSSIIRSIEGERGKYNGAQDWDLFLRATKNLKASQIHHIPKILYSWRIHDASTAKKVGAKAYVLDAQFNLLRDNLKDRGFSDKQFSIRRNHLLDGAWVVMYKGQDMSNMHLGGQPVEYSKIKGLAMSKKEIFKNIGRESLTTRVYRDSQYSIVPGREKGH